MATDEFKSLITIRIWNGCSVNALVTVTGNSYAIHGPVGSAANSTKVDIELDPWARLVVDNRVEFPTPVTITEDLENAFDE